MLLHVIYLNVGYNSHQSKKFIDGIIRLDNNLEQCRFQRWTPPINLSMKVKNLPLQHDIFRFNIFNAYHLPINELYLKEKPESVAEDPRTIDQGQAPSCCQVNRF